MLVLVRTYSFFVGGPALTGMAAYETRYLSNVESLALVVALGGAALLLGRRQPAGRMPA
jgi:hypothetical protein